MTSVERRVREALRARLNDPTLGFNARMPEAAADAGVVGVEIDFSLDSNNFVAAQIDPQTIEASTAIRVHPAWAAMFIQRVDDLDQQKYQTFSGTVQAVVDIHYYSKLSQIRGDMEAPLDAISAALMSSVRDVKSQGWPSSVVFTGALSSVRYPIVPAVRESWRQTCRTVFGFQVHTI